MNKECEAKAKKVLAVSKKEEVVGREKHSYLLMLLAYLKTVLKAK